ncbi:unnamed protein product, partial [Porites lobata]
TCGINADPFLFYSQLLHFYSQSWNLCHGSLRLHFISFGFGSLILGMVLFASTFASELCQGYAPELYYLCLSFGIFALLTTGFLVIMLPFWLMNYLWPDSVLNRRERRGICYEPVKCCTCLWHI